MQAGGAVHVPPDAIGIAIPVGHVRDVIAALHGLVEYLWNKEATIFDLCSGARIANEADFAETARRLDV